MTISEADKLERDISQLKRIRQQAEEEIRRAEGSRRPVMRWIVQRMTWLTIEIDKQIFAVQGERDRAEIRMRIGGRENDGSGVGSEGKDDGAGDAAAADYYGGCEQEVHQQEQQRADTQERRGGQLGTVGPVRGVSAEAVSGNRGGRQEGRTAEECLRSRHRERHERLADWQKEIMENERAGRHERLTL